MHHALITALKGDKTSWLPRGWGWLGLWLRIGSSLRSRVTRSQSLKHLDMTWLKWDLLQRNSMYHVLSVQHTGRNSIFDGHIEMNELSESSTLNLLFNCPTPLKALCNFQRPHFSEVWRQSDGSSHTIWIDTDGLPSLPGLSLQCPLHGVGHNGSRGTALPTLQLLCHLKTCDDTSTRPQGMSHHVTYYASVMPMWDVARHMAWSRRFSNARSKAAAVASRSKAARSLDNSL